MTSKRERGGGVLAESNGQVMSDNFRGPLGYGSQGRQRRRTECRTQWNSSSAHLPATPLRSYGGRQREQGRRGGHGKRSGTDEELLCSELYRRERKKSSPVSLTHLLNFTMPPRERQAESYSSRGGGGGGGWRSKKYHWHNKEQFVQANCQFVVREEEDYHIHSTDPDRLVDWSYVEQVRLFCHEIPSCPICLFPPTAAKITRCGHVYCYSCVLHYLALGDKKWRKCPICYESIYSKDLKSVTTQASRRVCVGDSIEMQLMIRSKGSAVTLPISKYQDEEDLTKLPVLNVGEWSSYAKLLTATSSQVIKIIEAEREELQQQRAKLDSSEDLERGFIESALESLREREEEEIKRRMDAMAQVKEVANTLHYEDARNGDVVPVLPVTERGKEDEEAPVIVDQPPATESNKSDGDDMCKEGETKPNMGTSDSCSAGSVSGSPSIGDYDRPGSVIFYQASDGQHLYLHPINTKCLLREYGGWESCPHVISTTVLEMERFSMTEEVRSRYRHLSHLPLTCEFALCELELQPPVVSQRVLSQFAETLLRRKQRRMKKKREEKRREQKAPYSKSISLPSNPSEITPEHLHDFLSMSSSPPLPPSLTPSRSAHTAPPEADSPVYDAGGKVSPSVPSFAQALASGEKKSTDTSRSVVGADLPRGTDSPVPCGGGDGEETAVPSFKDAFSEALLSASQSVMAASRDPGGRPGGSKSAKKGRKKLVLFTTGGTRRAM